METYVYSLKIPHHFGSYRTYEEWKHNTYYEITIERGLVLTVPMRNGNTQTRERFSNSLLVLTVPMRNGNQAVYSIMFSERSGSYRTYEEWKPNFVNEAVSSFTVLTVPMRNGNSKAGEQLFNVKDGSYRTYEEWKRIT